ncbi:MAG TPA: hypothetical protein ENH82_10465 [bacterium]|nr:hypothetical protein [bacterium]
MSKIYRIPESRLGLVYKHYWEHLFPPDRSFIIHVLNPYVPSNDILKAIQGKIPDCDVRFSNRFLKFALLHYNSNAGNVMMLDTDFVSAFSAEKYVEPQYSAKEWIAHIEAKELYEEQEDERKLDEESDYFTRHHMEILRAQDKAWQDPSGRAKTAGGHIFKLNERELFLRKQKIRQRKAQLKIKP